jgi:Kdo2-lipid IVA lauroyltransferase/acyltransferase
MMFSNLVYKLIKALGFFIYLLPGSFKFFICRLLAFFIFHILPFRKRIILHNLILCFPRQSQESMKEFRTRCEKIAKKNYQHYLLLILEILERFHWTEGTIDRRCSVENLQLLEKLRDDRKGYFFLTAHLGNWELLTFAATAKRIPLTIITRYLRNSFWDQLWVKSRRKYGLELLEESGSGLAAVRAVRKKSQAVGFILDQHTGPPHGILHQFFGVPAWCPKGLAILSMKLDCPVVPAYLFREGPSRYRIVVEKPLDFSSIAPVQGGLTESQIRQHIGICNGNMEPWIRRYPEQYLWLHKRFKGTIDYGSRLVWE